MVDATFGMAAARARQRIVNHFVAAGATMADRAIGYEPVDEAERLMFRNLARFGAIVEGTPGGYWLDPTRLAAFRRAMRRRTLGALAALGAAAVVAFVLAE